MITEYSCNK